MYIQFILDAYACVMYVTSYMMKSERAMGDLPMPLKRQSRKVVFINTDPKNERISLSKPISHNYHSTG